jgi:hypothetical protein
MVFVIDDERSNKVRASTQRHANYHRGPPLIRIRKIVTACADIRTNDYVIDLSLNRHTAASTPVFSPREGRRGPSGTKVMSYVHINLVFSVARPVD